MPNKSTSKNQESVSNFDKDSSDIVLSDISDSKSCSVSSSERVEEKASTKSKKPLSNISSQGPKKST